MDIVDRLIIERDIGCSTQSARDAMSDAANEIKFLRKQFLEGVTTILGQVQENSKIVKDAEARLDRAGL